MGTIHFHLYYENQQGINIKHIILYDEDADHIKPQPFDIRGEYVFNLMKALLI